MYDITTRKYKHYLDESHRLAEEATNLKGELQSCKDYILQLEGRLNPYLDKMPEEPRDPRFDDEYDRFGMRGLSADEKEEKIRQEEEGKRSKKYAADIKKAADTKKQESPKRPNI